MIESYFGQTLLGDAAFDRTKFWYWASAGKTLTAFTVGKAQEEGYLNIEDKTSDHLGLAWTSLNADDEAKITVKHQLTMTSGLDDVAGVDGGFLPEDLIFKSAAGTRWAYHNAPYTLLDQVIENAVGEDFDSYFNEVLRNKIGMDGLWTWAGNNHIYSSTARSMARYGLLILNNGDWGETAIIDDKDFVEAMITTSQDINDSYGYLWWLNGKSSFILPASQFEFSGSITPNAPADMISAVGKDGQYLSIVPSQNLIMVRMGESPNDDLVPTAFHDEIWEGLNLIIQ